MVESCGIALFKKMVVHSNSKVASSAEVKGYMKRPWEDQLGGFLHTFLECCKTGVLLMKKTLWLEDVGRLSAFSPFRCSCL